MEEMKSQRKRESEHCEACKNDFMYKLSCFVPLYNDNKGGKSNKSDTWLRLITNLTNSLISVV